VEPGEQCDPVTPNQCCVNCSWTIAPCDDLNPCTSGDTCNGEGSCLGTYKCNQSTECMSIGCDPSIQNAQCSYTDQPNGTNCKGENLCLSRCLSGQCDTTQVQCPTDNDPTNCMMFVCDPSTGNCTEVPKNNGTACNDNNACTVNDQCDGEGNCAGTEVTCEASTNPCQVIACNQITGACASSNINGLCNADNNSCTANDSCVNGLCTPGIATICTSNVQCQIAVCDPTSGDCMQQNEPDNSTCDDQNICTYEDHCTDGSCSGVPNPAYSATQECGGVSSQNNDNSSSTSLVIFTVAGAAALIGAIIGGAFLFRKIRNSRLTDPDTWNPQAFHSLSSNPLYQGTESSVNNPFYEDKNVE